MPISEDRRQLRQEVGAKLTLTPGVNILTFDQQNRVLLVRHQNNLPWEIPGGGMDPLQSPADAAVQLMWEETGLFVEPFRIIGAYGGDETFCRPDSHGNPINFVTIVFEAKVIGQKLAPPPVDTLETHYFDQDEIEQIDTHDWVRMILHDAYRNRNQANFDPPTWSPPTSGN